MSDVTTTTLVEKKTKAPVADKMFIDAAGNKAEIEKATGLSYTSLDTKTTFKYQIPEAEAGSVQTMLALFGATTLATNTASFNKNTAKDEDAFDDGTDAVKDRFERIADGDWGAKGGGGIKIDVGVLYDAVEEATGASPGPREDWIAKVTEDAAIRGSLRNHSDVAPIYERIMRERRAPKNEKPLASLLGAVKI